MKTPQNVFWLLMCCVGADFYLCLSTACVVTRGLLSLCLVWKQKRVLSPVNAGFPSFAHVQWKWWDRIINLSTHILTLNPTMARLMAG